MRITLGVLLVLLAPGCFEPGKPACVFLCGAGEACPEGYACGIDGRCHLMVAGTLAECEDQLGGDAGVDGMPPDGMADAMENPDGAPDGAPDGTPDASLPDGMVDARPPDAMVDARPPDAMVDARPPDAMVDAAPNMAPVMTLVPATTLYNVVAGDTVTIEVTATDGDAGDTLTYTAEHPGTNRDPFGAGPAGGTDVAPASFNPTARIFTFVAGPLGTFDVRFRVTDGRGGEDTADVRLVVAAHPVMLNEIQVVPDNVELINTGGTAVDVGGWRLCSPFVYYSIPAGTTIAAGGFLVVHWNQTGADTATEVYTGTIAALSSPAQLLLYAPTSDFNVSRLIRDFVRWASIMTGREGQAVYAGQWPSAGVITATPPDGQSIARTPGANTEAPADWTVDTTPTIGMANAP